MLPFALPFRIPRILSPTLKRPDPQADRARIEAALKTRLPAHLRKDVGGGD